MTTMAVLGAMLCAVFMVTLVTSKPVCLNEGGDLPTSSESSESSEETTNNGEPSQEPLQPEFTDTPDATEEANPMDSALLPSANAGPSPATPDPGDPQTSADTDALQLTPDDPSRTALGVAVPQDVPDSDPTQGPLSADTGHILPDTEAPLPQGLSETGVIIGTNQPQVTTTYQGSPQGATPPFPACVIQPTPISFATNAPLVIPVGTTLTGGPVCFNFQVTTPEPDPPRGDSI